MIKQYNKTQLDQIMAIWLQANIKAHDFIPSSYWQDNFLQVKNLLPEAELLVFEEDDVVKGFIGLVGDYVAGIFVRQCFQRQGIGKSLLEEVKQRYSLLELNVYEKNTFAVAFYNKQGFVTVKKKIDPATSEKEYLMRWESCR